MKAILCSQYCGPDDLVLADVPDPVAESGQAVIAIKAAALNFFDLLMIQGKYQIKPPFPFSPAAEVSGVIESVGAGVTDLKVGDRVVASCGHNGAREKIALPASSIVKIPDNLDFDRAAGIIIIYGTALHALELYAEAFDNTGALDKLEGFASFYGPDFYDLPRSAETVTLRRESWTLPAEFKAGDTDVVPLRGGEAIGWRLA